MPGAPNPYDFLPDAPTFVLKSNDIEDGDRMPTAKLSNIFGVEGGKDEAPALEWSGFPADTKSFVVTCYDPDAPTVSGFWHWIAYDIPASVSSLPTGGALPDGAKTLKNDAGLPGYLGCAPPPGHGDHRYIFCVSAMGVEELPIDENSSPSICGFQMYSVGVKARAFLTATYGR